MYTKTNFLWAMTSTVLLTRTTNAWFTECTNEFAFDSQSYQNNIKITTFNAEWLYAKGYVKGNNWKKGNEWNKRWDLDANDQHVLAVTQVVKDLKSDILFFQEVEDCKVLMKIAKALGGYGAYITLQDDHQNVGMLSRIKPKEWGSYKSVPHRNFYWSGPKKQFYATFVDVEGFKNFKVFGMHLKAPDGHDAFESERQRQAKAMMVEAKNAMDGGWNVVVLGDMNSRPGSSPLKVFDYNLRSVVPTRVEQPTHYRGQLDHIYVNGNLYNRIQGCEFGTSKRISVGRTRGKYESDHIPLSVIIQSEANSQAL